jgi:hypothetical protein
VTPLCCAIGSPLCAEKKIQSKAKGKSQKKKKKQENKKEKDIVSFARHGCHGFFYHAHRTSPVLIFFPGTTPSSPSTTTPHHYPSLLRFCTRFQQQL